MVINALQTVYDPEIPVIIYDLGLIYKLEIANSGNVRIEMTLTALGCPVAGILPQQVAEAAASINGIDELEVYLVWEPIWDMANISEDAKLALGLFKKVRMSTRNLDNPLTKGCLTSCPVP
jgi:FeS assembly SUF system protein